MVGDFHHLVVEHHRQVVAHVRAGEMREPPPAFARQEEIHFRLARLAVAARVARRASRDQLPPRRAR